MIALGFSLPHAALPAPFVPARLPGCALIMAPDALAATARARLVQQVSCLRHLETFLPLAPSRALSERQARDLTQTQAEALHRALGEARGQVQLRFLATRLPFGDETTAPGLRGAAWLRQRAELRQDWAEAQAALRRHVKDAALACDAQKVVDRPYCRGLCLDVLVRREVGDRVKRQLGQALSAPGSVTRGWQASLTGAWPPSAVWREGEAA